MRGAGREWLVRRLARCGGRRQAQCNVEPATVDIDAEVHRRLLHQLARVLDATEHVEGLDGEKELAQLLGIKFTPTIVFLDKQGSQIFRTNGYRNPKLFGHTVEYVASNNTKTQTLNQFIAGKSNPEYNFISHPLLEKVSDFSGFSDPVIMLFEDKRCTGCSQIHSKLLNREDVLEELDKFLFVRFDADSDEQIIDFDGSKTTPKQIAQKYSEKVQFIQKYKLSYRPGMLLFDEGKKIIEIDNRLYSFHFNAVLSFVSGRNHKTHDDFNAYRNALQAKLLEQGVDINMVD